MVTAMSLSEGDVVELEVVKREHSGRAVAESEEYTVLLDKQVDEGLHKVKITETGLQFAFGEIVEEGENP